MKKFGFLLAAVLFAQTAIANKATYTNAAVAIAETGIAVSWAEQPKQKELELNNDKLTKQMEAINNKLNAKLEARMAKMLEAKLYQ